MPTYLDADNPISIGHMPQYGFQHSAVLLLTVVLAATAVPLVRKRPRVIRPAGWVILLSSLLWLAWGFLPGNFLIEESLPLHYSDALRIFTAIALITRARWAVSVTILWGLTINMMSLLTPDLNYYHMPLLEFFFYWFLHISVFVAAVALVWGLGLRPGMPGFVITLAITVGWGISSLIVNAITGANYGYLSRAPRNVSVLDYFGGWPFYIVAEFLLLGFVWALITAMLNRVTLPYTPKTRKGTANPVDGASISSAP